MNRFHLPLACAVLMLAACNDSAAPVEGGLQGEVLEGTISDAMVPLDQVRSRAPLAQPGEGNAGEGDAPSGRTSEQAADLDAEQPTPEPAPTPVTTTDGQTG